MAKTEWMDCRIKCFLIPCIATLINVVPFFGNVHITSYSENLALALRSAHFRDIFILAIGITIPMMFDVVTFVFHRDAYYITERFILAAACNIPLSLLFDHRYNDRVDLIYSSTSGIQSAWIYYILFIGTHSSQLKAWNNKLLSVSFICCCIGQFQPYFLIRDPVGISFMWISIAIYLFGVILVLYGFIGYLRSLWVNRADHAVAEYFPLLCSTLIIIYSIGNLIPYLYWSASHYQDMKASCLSYTIFLNQCVALLMTILPGRIARMTVVEVQSSLEMKKSFIRYIGHEIRTPLNVATIGLDLLSAAWFTSAPSSVISRHTSNPYDSNHVPCEPSSLKATDSAPQSLDDCIARQLSDMFELNQTFIGRLNSSPTLLKREMSQSPPHNQVKGVNFSSRALDADLFGVLTEVRKAVYFGTDILDSLLAYDKLETKNMVVEMSSLNVEEVVTNSLSLFKMQAAAKGVNFLTNIETGMPSLLGDEYKIRQILCNLVSNALKFTPTGGTVTVSVRSEFSASVRFLRIECKDSGIGIAKENLPQVFKKIVQFDANTNQKGKGSGIGLYITRGLVELHGGTASVISGGLGTGCTFTVMLPFSGKVSSPSLLDNLRKWLGRRRDSKWIPRGSFSLVTEHEDMNSHRFGERHSAVHDILDIEEGVKFNHSTKVESSLSDAAQLKVSGRVVPVEISNSLDEDHNFNFVICENASAPERLQPLSPPPRSPVVSAIPALTISSVNSDLNLSQTIGSISSAFRGTPRKGLNLSYVETCDSTPRPLQVLTGRSFSSGNVNAKEDMNTVLQNRTACIQPNSGHWLSGVTGLIVDDSSSSLKMVSMLLKKLGCNCLTAIDGSQAVETMKKVLETKSTSNESDLHPSLDFVLMDNYMPNLNGPDAARIMRQMGFNGPIIGLTGHALQEDISNFKEAGADHVLTKPLDVSSLQHLLKTCIPSMEQGSMDMC